MLEDALKNLFPYKEISLKTGDTVEIEKCFYYIKEGQVAELLGIKFQKILNVPIMKFLD